jgi:hypothetical protein
LLHDWFGEEVEASEQVSIVATNNAIAPVVRRDL